MDSCQPNLDSFLDYSPPATPDSQTDNVGYNTGTQKIYSGSPGNTEVDIKIFLENTTSSINPLSLESPSEIQDVADSAAARAFYILQDTPSPEPQSDIMDVVAPDFSQCEGSDQDSAISAPPHLSSNDTSPQPLLPFSLEEPSTPPNSIADELENTNQSSGSLSSPQGLHLLESSLDTLITDADNLSSSEDNSQSISESPRVSNHGAALGFAGDSSPESEPHGMDVTVSNDTQDNVESDTNREGKADESWKAFGISENYQDSEEEGDIHVMASQMGGCHTESPSTGATEPPVLSGQSEVEFVEAFVQQIIDSAVKVALDASDPQQDRDNSRLHVVSENGSSDLHSSLGRLVTEKEHTGNVTDVQIEPSESGSAGKNFTEIPTSPLSTTNEHEESVITATTRAENHETAVLGSNADDIPQETSKRDSMEEDNASLTLDTEQTAVEPAEAAGPQNSTSGSIDTLHSQEHGHSVSELEEITHSERNLLEKHVINLDHPGATDVDTLEPEKDMQIQDDSLFISENSKEFSGIVLEPSGATEVDTLEEALPDPENVDPAMETMESQVTADGILILGVDPGESKTDMEIQKSDEPLTDTDSSEYSESNEDAYPEKAESVLQNYNDPGTVLTQGSDTIPDIVVTQASVDESLTSGSDDESPVRNADPEPHSHTDPDTDSAMTILHHQIADEIVSKAIEEALDIYQQGDDGQSTEMECQDSFTDTADPQASSCHPDHSQVTHTGYDLGSHHIEEQLVAPSEPGQDITWDPDCTELPESSSTISQVADTFLPGVMRSSTPYNKQGSSDGSVDNSGPTINKDMADSLQHKPLPRKKKVSLLKSFCLTTVL